MDPKLRRRGVHAASVSQGYRRSVFVRTHSDASCDGLVTLPLFLWHTDYATVLLEGRAVADSIRLGPAGLAGGVRDFRRFFTPADSLLDFRQQILAQIFGDDSGCGQFPQIGNS